MKKYRFILLGLILFMMFPSCSSFGGKMDALIITGQNNHHWEVSSTALQQILDNSGLFHADLAVSPAKGEDMSGFNVDFSAYDVVVLDYNGDSWSEEMKEGFIRYIENGGGLVLYHASDNSFPDWKEYNEIAGFGGWKGRDSSSGPYIYMSDGEVIYDDRPGKGGAHGPQSPYVLEIADTLHPVTAGMPRRWMHAKDELYSRMRGPGKIATPLYTSFSTKENKGSGRDELVLFTVSYKDARIFHMTMGHAGNSLEDNPSMQCTGFQVCLLRGAEWAATGKVTQKLPDDFPGEEEVSYRMQYGR